MVTIAVAGGTRGIGRTIAETIKRQGKHKVKVISRSPNPELAAEMGCEIIATDYSDVDSLTKILEDNNIDTVISTMFLTSTGEPQNNLILAADRSSVTRRFIPSIWGIPYTKEQLSTFEIGRAKLAAYDYLSAASTLEHTSFYVGYFLDFWGWPKVPSYQNPNLVVVDIKHDVAAIPGKGDTPVTFTHTSNVAEFVAKSLELERWEKESYAVGEKVTWKEFVGIAEEVKGTKFKVTYDDMEVLRQGKVTELPSHPSLYSQMPKETIQSIFSVFGIWFEEGLFDLKPEKTLNEVFPEIEVWTVRQVLERGWGSGK